MVMSRSALNSSDCVETGCPTKLGLRDHFPGIAVPVLSTDVWDLVLVGEAVRRSRTHRGQHCKQTELRYVPALRAVAGCLDDHSAHHGTPVVERDVHRLHERKT